MFDISMYARRIAIVLGHSPPNFARCRQILMEAEEAWNKTIGGQELSDAEKLELPLVETGLATKLVNTLEDRLGAIYVNDLVGVAHVDAVACPMLTDKIVLEIRGILGESFCRKYGIFWRTDEAHDL